jgi:hypothetical protein
MLGRVGALLCIVSLALAVPPPSHRVVPKPRDQNRYARQLLPAVVELIDRIAKGGLLERRPPAYAAISMDRDEYIYHLSDKVFIRRVKNRYEKPTGRTCGDVAVVRVELMDDAMKTLPPVMAWYMIYRDDRWQKMARDDEGRFVWENWSPVELPPYALRCFDHVE